MPTWDSLLQGGLILVHAVIIALLIRIALVDFRVQKITNRDVLLLGGTGGAALVLGALQGIEQQQADVWWNVYLSLTVGAVLFVGLFPFWLLRKVGAGDVKLMAVTPLVAGAENMFLFALLLLALAALVAFFVRNPMLIPAPLVRQYLQHFERKGVVPFGVPIAGALLGVEILRALAFRLELY
jgi:prepilin peptidase CpaA